MRTRGGFDEMGTGNDMRDTWAGPIKTDMYSEGLKALCSKTQDNLNRLSYKMEKTDPCLEYGMKHWHPSKRPSSGNDKLRCNRCF